MATETLKNQLKLLVKLATTDHRITERESKLIHQIGKVNGFSAAEIDTLIEHPEDLPAHFAENLSEEERFENLLHLTQMMKSDGEVHKSEINFCEHMAVALGYRKGVVAEMSAHVYRSPKINVERNTLIKIAGKFLVKK